MSLDELEVELRGLRGVLAVGFVERDGLLVVELQAGMDAPDDLPVDATELAVRHASSPVAVEVVRWGDGRPPTKPRVRFVQADADPGAGEIAVELEHEGERIRARSSSAGGLLGAVDATVTALRLVVPALPFLAGWARTVETTPDRRFLVIASLTDPETQRHRRGIADGANPVEGAARATLAALNRTIDVTDS